MHFTNSLTTLAGLTIATASAIPSQAADHIANGNPTVEKRTLATSATCSYTATSYAFDVTFYGVTTDENDYDNCEEGFLDNLRGQCLGYVMDWGCTRNSDGSLSTSGYVPMGGKSCVQDAIYLSQGGLSGVECETLY